MVKQIWLNLPVKNAKRSKEFFTKIGFGLNEKFSAANSVALEIGEKDFIVMLFEEKAFKEFTKSEISDAKAGAEVLISFGAESRDEIDETASKVFDAGGTIFSEPAEIQGWMYGFAFCDLDGHRWNMLYIEPEKMPQE